MLRFWNVLVLVLVLNFESFFCDLLASVGLVNKKDAKVSIKTKTKKMTVQNRLKIQFAELEFSKSTFQISSTD